MLVRSRICQNFLGGANLVVKKERKKYKRKEGKERKKDERKKE